ncbi:hypothetical protein [Photorhabdus caribbeanensis]|nr:hypothetical protein [Photorhabdus caribbeanensis]
MFAFPSGVRLRLVGRPEWLSLNQPCLALTVVSGQRFHPDSTV